MRMRPRYNLRAKAEAPEGRMTRRIDYNRIACSQLRAFAFAAGTEHKASGGVSGPSSNILTTARLDLRSVNRQKPTIKDSHLALMMR